MVKKYFTTGNQASNDLVVIELDSDQNEVRIYLKEDGEFSTDNWHIKKNFDNKESMEAFWEGYKQGIWCSDEDVPIWDEDENEVK